MEYEFEYLSKLKSKTKFALITKEKEYECPKGQEFQGSKRKIRFKEIKANDAKHKIEEGEKYENLIRRVSSQQLCKVPFEL